MKLPKFPEIPFKRQISTILLAALVATLTAVVWDPPVNINLLALLHGIELSGYDMMFALRGEKQADPNLMVLGYDRQCEVTFGQPWPPKRSLHAQAIRNLVDDGVKAIGYDVLFSDPSHYSMRTAENVESLTPDGLAGYKEDKLLHEALLYAGEKHVPVVLTCRIDRSATEKRRAAEFPYYNDKLGIDFEAWAKEGLAEVDPDSDKVVRRMVPTMNHQDEWIPSLPLGVYLAINGNPNDEKPIKVEKDFVIAGKLKIPRTGPTSMDPVMFKEIPSTYIDLPGGLNAIPMARFDQVVGKDGKLATKPGTFKGKVVFIGTTGAQLTKALGEDFNTAYTHYSRINLDKLSSNDNSGLYTDRIPGVVVQAQIFNALETSSFITTANGKIVWIITFIFSLLATYLVRHFMNWRGPVLLLTSVLIYFILSFFLFKLNNFFLPWVIPSLFILVGAGSISWVERGNLKKKWAGYVSPAVLETILRQEGNMGASRINATVIFGDIRNFTGFSEAHPPEQVVRLLNKHLSRLTSVIYQEGGTIDKFLGDGILVVFGAPIPQENAAYHAVKSAVKMRDISLEQFPDDDGTMFSLASGFGITTGPLVSGHVGSEQRHEFTIIGDTVNLSSRLQGVTGKPDVVIDHPTFLELEQYMDVESLGEVTLKGKTNPVACYKVVKWYDEPKNSVDNLAN
ncbi:MAG: adenylate/guanylate cyclase domain-containing protein [bacterium]